MLIKDRFLFPAADGCVDVDAHPMTLLEELQATILARIGRGTECDPIAAHIKAALSALSDGPRGSLPDAAPASHPTERERPGRIECR